MDSLAFLERAGKCTLQPVYVLLGEDDFLKRQVRRLLRSLVLGKGEGEIGLSRFSGETAVWSEVNDELKTLPFLGSHRLVLVEEADLFVTNHRPALEKYVKAPSSTGVLVLDVKSWPKNTRLARMIDMEATIVCEAPKVGQLPDWCIHWGATQYGKQLVPSAARLLVDLVEPDLGVLDQELAKLATYVGEAERVETEDVDRLVGKSRAADTWKIFNAIGAGQMPEALKILDRLVEQGESPIMLLGAFSKHLRQLAQAARLCLQGIPLRAALEQVGVPPFALREREQLLRHLGRRRIERLYDWLLEADTGLKGGSQLPYRTQLERLVVRLANRGQGSGVRGQ
jgi:DNA polymerase-3 subunit delta